MDSYTLQYNTKYDAGHMYKNLPISVTDRMVERLLEEKCALHPRMSLTKTYIVRQCEKYPQLIQNMESICYSDYVQFYTAHQEHDQYFRECAHNADNYRKMKKSLIPQK
jgi:hypothetical protein